MYLYTSTPASGGGSGYSVTKLFSVPHGIAVTAIGNHSTYSEEDAQCEMLNQQRAIDTMTVSTPDGTCKPDPFYIPTLPEFHPTLNGFITDETEKLSGVNEFVST